MLIRHLNRFLVMALTLGALGIPFAHATVVTEIDDSFVADGRWFKSGVSGGGTATIQDLTGLGGNLENSAPLPTGKTSRALNQSTGSPIS